ncbi:hypothetical protein [Calothrix sp. PCC 6303]|uniref:hypothetical protein n=1 Tax=Calothrix sp. PCC 6303 TaxID=1170562 RepID=UPI000318811E|nr:hypothetical protein [Calothrix sp. PCC 6303]
MLVTVPVHQRGFWHYFRTAERIRQRVVYHRRYRLHLELDLIPNWQGSVDLRDRKPTFLSNCVISKF